MRFNLSTTFLYEEENYFQIARKDHVLMSVIDTYGLPNINRREKNFETFVRIIVNQQLSDAAASTIMDRFKKLFQNREISAQETLSIADSELRNVGISFAKISYIKGVADIFCKTPDFINEIQRMSDEELTTTLSQIRGFGRWSCSIYALFYAGRPNIFVYGDVSINKAICDLYNIEKKDIEYFLETKITQWSPFNSIACLLLWHYIDSNKINNRV